MERKPGSDQELAIITSQLRRRISSATIKVNYALLLERIAQIAVEVGAERTETRRKLVRAEDEQGQGGPVPGQGEGPSLRGVFFV
jgi:hypothetical protein